MATPRRSSISLPIVLSSIAVALTIALLVGWTLVIARYMNIVKGAFAANVWLLAGGIVSFLAILAVLVLFTVFLVREIREVRRQTSFIDSMTHELKTPLASLRLCAETLARPQLAPDRRELLRKMMLEDVERLVVLVDGILEASRVDDENEAREVDEIELADFVDEVVGEIRHRHHLSTTQIDVEIRDDAVLLVDPHALRTVLRNLLDNAVKYSDADPQVSLHAGVEGRRYVIEVRDHGIGIAKPDLPRIFDRFYRGPDEAVRERHGTGLGLFVVSALARAMSGKVEAHSEGPGTGTTIRVLLPMRKVAEGSLRAAARA